MSGVYDGLLVVELADRRNQFAGKLLSDGGGRVIQVEPPGGGAGRWCGPFVDDAPHPDRCLDYWYYGTGKESVALDVTRRPAQDLLRRLLAKADVFIESTPPGSLATAGLDYASVASNRSLIYASLTDFGQDGPWRDFQMNDAAHLALGGTMGVSGYSDSSAPPIGGQGHQAWHMGCVFTLHGVTLALFDRMTSGLGQYIDVSIHDCCGIGTEGAVPQWLYYGETFYRQMGMHAAARRQPPLELPTADGKYVMANSNSFSNNAWINLVRWMEEKGVAGELADPKYLDEHTRALEFRQGSALRDGIRRLVAACTGDEAFHRSQAMGLTWGVVRGVEENYGITQYDQRDYWRPIEQPEIGRAIPFPRGPWLADALQIEPRRRAPHLGEHTRSVLEGDLGLSGAQVDALIASGVAR